MRPTSSRKKTGGRRVIQTSGQGGQPPPRYVKKRTGIKRATRNLSTAAELPMTDNHRAVLNCLQPLTPSKPKQIAEQTGLKYTTVTSALYAIQARGFATKLPNRRGWIRDGL